MAGFQMRWDPVYGNISPELAKQQGYGSIIGDMKGALNEFANARRAENTQAALLDIARINSTDALAAQRGDLNTLIDGSGRAVDQAGLLKAIEDQNTLLKGKEQQAALEADTASVNRARINGATLEDIQALGNMVDPRNLGLVAGLADTSRDAAAAAEKQAYDRQVEQTELGIKVAQNARNDVDQQMKLAEFAVKYPDQVTTETIYDANGNAQQVHTVKPGFMTNYNNFSASNGANGVSTFVDKIIGAESSNNPNAKNPNSTATGGGQFIESTWMNMIQKYRPELTQGKSRQEILDMRKDMNLSREMTKYYAEENAAALGKGGFAPTATNIYLSHFAGPDGAVKLLKADPNTPTSKIFSAEAIRKNASVLKGKTAADVINWAGIKMGDTSGGGALATAAAGNTPAGTGTGKPAGPLDRMVQEGSIRVSNASMEKARGTLAASLEASNNKDAIARGTKDYTQAEYDYKQYIKQNSVADSKVYRTLYNDKAYNRLAPDEKLKVLKSAVEFDKTNTPFFSLGANAKDVKAHIDTQIAAIEKQRKAAQRSGVLNELIAQGTAMLPEAKQTNPNATLDQVMKAINPTLYKELEQVRKNSTQHL